MSVLLEYQWEIFILAEVLSLVSLLLFGAMRYWFNKRKISSVFLLIFLSLLIFEGVLALIIYQAIGEITSFQIVILLFIVYACTFGILDFRKLDRWMRLKIGKWRGIDILSEKDKQVLNKQNDSKHIARMNRYNSLIHLIIFLLAQVVFWSYGLNGLSQAMDYLTDLSWIGTDDYVKTPYPNEMLYNVSMIWGIIFIVDFLYAWSYTIFPEKTKRKV